MNNPVRFVDPTGKWIVGTDGEPVFYSKEIGWSGNASDDVKTIGNAMLKTETGQERLNAMFNNTEKISITLSPDIVLKDGGYSVGRNDKINQKLFPDGSIKVGEHKITINKGSIEKLISQDAGENPIKGLTMDQAIGAVAGHESGHTEKENVKQSYENHYTGTNYDLEVRPDEIMNKILQELKELQPIRIQIK